MVVEVVLSEAEVEDIVNIEISIDYTALEKPTTTAATI
jgi:hypothetical protein